MPKTATSLYDVAYAGDDCGFPERDEVIEKVAGLVAHVEQVLS